MAEYKVSVTTGGMQHAGTLDNIFIVLFGSEGHSERARLDNSGIDFKSGTANEDLQCEKRLFSGEAPAAQKYVSKHWKEDDFFGYQFLNATNPNVIKRCRKLPPNFPVTEEMVKPCLPNGFTLKEEMELNQKASAENPVFLPTDPEKDWLLAKLFFKSADLVECEVVHHLLITHFLSEVFAVATLRCFPTIHPLYKLLIPHFRFTLHINIMGREALLGPDGALCTSSFGLEGLLELMGRALSEVTYSSLCLPENITARGLESIPNFYYRDDALKLWNIIESFVRSVVKDYYPLRRRLFVKTLSCRSGSVRFLHKASWKTNNQEFQHLSTLWRRW
ncbi:Arachidonate 8S-lipoxygenase [Oryzias melastigma]|uniref:Arachidonate 8S-lipoxygenase n=1 Tax=Oryzias melastigma TaxID=30732 RepID=A0A834F7Y8_ORYME|nr:Arachidonate 8S-lipoxygenase [Oryzias melastigma]